jgi:Hsp90 protein
VIAERFGSRVSVVLSLCRMKEGQAGIYYICTDSKRQAEAAPFTEQLVRKGYEVRWRPFVAMSCSCTLQAPDSKRRRQLQSGLDSKAARQAAMATSHNHLIYADRSAPLSFAAPGHSKSVLACCCLRKGSSLMSVSGLQHNCVTGSAV